MMWTTSCHACSEDNPKRRPIGAAAVPSAMSASLSGVPVGWMRPRSRSWSQATAIAVETVSVAVARARRSQPRTVAAGTPSWRLMGR